MSLTDYETRSITSPPPLYYTYESICVDLKKGGFVLTLKKDTKINSNIYLSL